MDTNRIKRFATEARNILKAGIAAKITTLGFDKKGNVAEEHRPQLMQGGALWNGQFYTEGFYYQWMSLYNRIQQKGINEVYEEAAYTWFNRLCAIRILQKNNLCSPVLQYADAARTPIIVDEARQGHLPQMKEDLRQRIVELLDDDTKVTEQFALLITAWCHDNPILNQCFGSMADYTELLLPNDILAEGKFMDMLNHTEFITDEEFQSPELIGWLYQFYISERKDEVFAKKGKFEADEIPAATQIFTPNWIVKYMVQNTVGRIYLDNNPYETTLQKKWRYLVNQTEKPTPENLLKYNELTDLKVADLACGSGHILNECFDLFYDLYIAEGYGRGEAIENIFRHNLTGIDLDNRAKQLATFALLLKACQKDSSFADAHCLPNILTMPKPWNEETDENLNDFLSLYFQGENTSSQNEELAACFELMHNADSLGSIMKFDISDSTRLLVKQTTDYWCSQEIMPDAVRLQLPAFELILALTEKYDALVMNPPYMGGGNMNEVLSKYVKANYEEGKGDLFSTFMLLAIDRLADNGKYSMINMQSWMFLSSFEKLRTSLLENYHIENMLHLGPRTFDELSGEVVQNTSFVVAKNKSDEGGVYFRLVDGKNCAEKKDMFLQALQEHTAKVYYPNVPQSNFEKIPGCPIGYWVSPNILKIFTSNLALSAVASPCVGLQTADNARFLRSWFEVSRSRIGFGFENAASAARSRLKWFPYNKGGDVRRWYGLNLSENIIDWYNDGEILKSFKPAVIRNPGYYFTDGITFPRIGSNLFYARILQPGFIFDCNGPSCFPQEKKEYILGFLNSKVMQQLLFILCPTLSFQIGDSFKVPYIGKNNDYINHCVQQNINISKQDWDNHETSWDFETNPLLAVNENTYIDNIRHEEKLHEKETDKHICINPAAPQLGSLKWRMEQYKTKWEHLFMQLHENEEELNRQFIDIYGLQDELTPDVTLSEITILQQGEINIADDSLSWNDEVLMKQLISFAVGCMLGRYRLDKPGLHIAHPNPTDEETASYTFNGQSWEIDDDGIMPLMANDCGFSDNASYRFADFLRVVLGEELHVENLNYVEQCLGKTIEQYFVKDFWKDHKKMYQNRPIYWLFASKKGSFQVIAYMHRMNAYTVERIRAKYLLPFIEHLEQEINKLDLRRAELTTKESKQLQTLQKQLDECREYHERLQVVAEQAISFNLDDGVTVNYAKFGDVLQKIK